MESKIINNVVRFSEGIDNGTVKETELLKRLNLIKQNPNINLGVYRGYLISYHFYKFRKYPSADIPRDSYFNKIFLKCDAIFNGSVFTPIAIGKLFLEIISISDDQQKIRDMLLGGFYCCLWQFMNNPKNLEIATRYGLEIIKSAFSLDGFDYLNKIDLAGRNENVRIVNLAGSGKKEIKLLNISSLSAVITAAISKKFNGNIAVEKIVSRATSSITGSGEIFESLGVNVSIPRHKMAEISLETKLGVFDINNIVPKLNHIYDGRLYNVQVFAGLVGGAAIVNPIDSNLINYGLTRGLNKLCLSILGKLYPDKNILILSGKNPEGKSIIDQISVVADTDIAQRVNGENSFYSITPEEFGFEFKTFRYIQTTKKPKENIVKFIELLTGHGKKNLKQAVAMEVALNLYGLGVVNNLKDGTLLALQTIDSGDGINVLENLIIASGGDINRFNSLLKKKF